MILSADTNLLVYAQDNRDVDKQRSAQLLIQTLVDSGTHRLALQVAGELFSVLTRRLKMPTDIARDATAAYLALFDTYEYSNADVHSALSLSADGVFSYWDGLLVTSAARSGCHCLISEDMQNGFRYGDLEIVTPFSDGRPNPRLLQLLSS